MSQIQISYFSRHFYVVNVILLGTPFLDKFWYKENFVYILWLIL